MKLAVHAAPVLALQGGGNGQFGAPVSLEAGATVVSTGFRGCRITWHRQVSPAPAVATFADVPSR